MSQQHQIDSYWKDFGTSVVLELAVYLRTLRTYESNNALVTNSQQQLFKTLSTHFVDRRACPVLSVKPSSTT